MFNLKLNNFRSFQNQSFEFSRINILIGENSGGKSSLLKFLLALKQTIESPLESNLKLIGDYTDLGNYEEMIYDRDKNLVLDFEFSNSVEYTDYFIKKIVEIEFGDEEDEDENYEVNEEFIKHKEKKLKEISKIITKYINNETSVKITINNKLDEHHSLKTIFENKSLGKLELVTKKTKNEDFFRDLICDIKYDFKFEKGIIKDCTSFKEGFFTLVGAELKSKISKVSESKQQSDKLFYSIAFLIVYQNFLIDIIDKIKFVNPIGNTPRRLYFREDKKSSYKLIDIEKFINILGNPSLTKKEYQHRINLINKTINEFGIAEEIEIVKNDNLPIVALNVKTKNFWSNITDVGFGVSLQLPILFQALLSEHFTNTGEILLIEQPEVHLHPNLQAKFINSLLSIGKKNSYFIETHSEHIIRKLQILVKSKSLKSTDVSIYYFKREENKFKISKHIIQENGKLSEKFPDGFFDTSYSLVKELLG